MTDDQVRALSDGNSIPLLGLGVWQVPDGTQTVNSVRWALELGYRHIDTAQAYGNEKGVGQGLRESGIRREDVFITTKFNPNRSDPARELEGSLKRLGVDQVDLYLVSAGSPARSGSPTTAPASSSRCSSRGRSPR
jgi:diketogulonate reductase-like aldo/keto reductase